MGCEQLVVLVFDGQRKTDFSPFMGFGTEQVPFYDLELSADADNSSSYSSSIDQPANHRGRGDEGTSNSGFGSALSELQTRNPSFCLVRQVTFNN